jgi:hypothetical protein
MITKNYCNSIYKDLCARLGELQIKKDVIDVEIKQILAQITLLNSMVPKLNQLEQEIVAGEKTV